MALEKEKASANTNGSEIEYSKDSGIGGGADGGGDMLDEGKDDDVIF
jgi:hypothetical protein